MKYLRYFEKINHKPNPLDVIVDAYLETSLWSVKGTSEEFEDVYVSDFSDDAKKQAREEIEWFLKNAGEVFGEVSNTTIGHDLWLSRNHHGTGFFDRSGYDEDTAKFLTDLSHVLDDISMYVGDDDKIYFEKSDKYKSFDIVKFLKDKEEKDRIKKYNL